MYRYAVQYVFHNGHASVLFLIGGIHQDLCDGLGFDPPARRVGILAAGLMAHVCHGFDQKAAGAACAVQYAVVLVDLRDLIHEVGNVFGGEDLPRFGLFLITVEFAEENAHHVFPAPFAGADIFGDLRDPVNGIMDGLLIVRCIILISEYSSSRSPIFIFWLRLSSSGLESTE